MKQAILDTSFILTCIKQKIDFIEELKFMGLEILIPNQVIKEIEGLSKTNENAKLALKIMQKPGLEKIDLKGKDTDNAIIIYANKNPKAIIATLDEAIKKKIKNNKLVIRGKKKLEII